MTDICQHCGKGMLKTQHNQRYHTDCRRKVKNAAIYAYRRSNPKPKTVHVILPRPCKRCGNDFTPELEHTKYCCDRCRLDAKYVRRGGQSVDEEHESGWARPSPPTVPKFTKMVHRIFFEMRYYA